MEIKRQNRTIILVHNHPSGDPSPSQADIQMTKAIIDIAAPLGISVHDHIIVGKNGHASLKGMRLIAIACIYHLLTIRFALWRMRERVVHRMRGGSSFSMRGDR